MIPPTEPRRSLLVANSDWHAPSETFVRDHVRLLRRWHPYVVALGRPGDVDPAVAVRGLELGRFSLRNLAFQTLGWSRAAADIVASARPLFCHVHFLTNAAFMLPFLERSGLPFWVTAHGFDVTTDRFDGVLRRTMMRHRLARVFERAERILCVSDYIRRCVLARGCPADKALTHHLGIPVPPLPAVERRPSTVLFVGRLVPKKGLLTLLRAAALVRDGGTAVALRVVGEGPDSPEGHRLAAALGLDVTWLGARPRAVVLDEMARATVFCMPASRAPNGDNEGFGLVYLEAQAMETPVVAFDQGPLPEAVVDGVTGLLAPDRDVGGLASRLARLLRDEALASDLGRAGRLRVIARFDALEQSRRLEELYDEWAEVRELEGSRTGRHGIRA